MILADSQLSGRALEIAVAKALGYEEAPLLHMTDYHSYRRITLRRCIDGEWVYLKKTVRRTNRDEDVWPHVSPKFLTDSAAFATVLAALDAADVAWYVGRSDSLYLYWASIQPDLRDVLGTTYQEAMCRAVVAWKAQS